MNPFLKHILYYHPQGKKFQIRPLRAVITYQFLIICIGVFVLAAIADIMLGVYWLCVVSIGCIALFIGNLYLHYKEQYKWVTSIAIIIINFLIFIHDAYYGVQAGVSFFYFPLIFSIFSTITFKSRNYFYFHLAFTIICWLIVEITGHSLLFQSNFPSETLHKVHIFCMVLALVATLCFVYFIFAQIRNNAIAQERERLKAIVDNNNQFIILLNSERKIELFNKKTYDYFKTEYNKVLEHGKDYLGYIPSSNFIEFEDGFKKALTGQVIQKDTQLQSGDSFKWATLSFVPIFDKDEAVMSVVISMLDISERKDSEKNLQETNDKLNKVNRELDHFIYRSSHDMRAPLSSIIGLVELIQTEDDEEERKEYVSLIGQSVSKLDQLLIDIAQYAKNKNMDIRSQPIHFTSLVEDLINGIKFTKKAQSIHFQTSIQQKDIFYGDEERIRSIIGNLLSNAVRYSKELPSSFVSITINVTDRVQIYIRDNGIGIEKEYQSKVFDMFFKVSNLSSGSGLGLYIIKETVKTLGGYIDVQSIEDIGTSFMVELPCQPKNPDLMPDTCSQQPKQSDYTLTETGIL